MQFLLKKILKWCTVCFEVFLTVNGDVGRPVDNRHDGSDVVQNTP